MTTVQKAKDAQRLLDSASTEDRRKARENHENAYMLCRLYWLGLVSVKPEANDCLDALLKSLQSAK